METKDDIKFINIRYRGNLECIDGFPLDCQRSNKGSMHLRPNCSKKITSQEIKYIEEQRPDVFKFIEILPVKKVVKSVVLNEKKILKKSNRNKKKK